MEAQTPHPQLRMPEGAPQGLSSALLLGQSRGHPGGQLVGNPGHIKKRPGARLLVERTVSSSKRRHVVSEVNMADFDSLLTQRRQIRAAEALGASQIRKRLASPRPASQTTTKQDQHTKPSITPILGHHCITHRATRDYLQPQNRESTDHCEIRSATSHGAQRKTRRAADRDGREAR